MRRRSARHDAGAFVLEGPTLVAEALAAGIDAEVFAEPGTALARIDHEVAPGVLGKVLDTITPRPVAAIVPASAVFAPPERLAGATFVVVCAGVADPGNLGTILRSACAAGADAVVVTEGSVDVLNPKVVRASAGTILRIPVVGDLAPVEALERLRQCGLRRIATRLDAATPHDRATFTDPVAIVLGNEAHGLDPSLDPHVDERVVIRMPGPAESLNVAMAATVLCFEVVRQRLGRHG